MNVRFRRTERGTGAWALVLDAALALPALALILSLATACGQNEPAGETAAADGVVAAPPAAGDPAVTTASLSHDEMVRRGEYLVTIGGCHDCHTPWIDTENGPQPDMSRQLSGHPQDLVMEPAPQLSGNWIAAASATNTAWAGPWGISYTMNLTPDENTGLGIWTEEMFMTAIREGKHMGQSRPIAPPMPWFNYAKMTDEDLKSVFAYLKSLPPIANRVPEYVPPAGTVAAGG